MESDDPLKGQPRRTDPGRCCLQRKNGEEAAPRLSTRTSGKSSISVKVYGEDKDTGLPKAVAKVILGRENGPCGIRAMDGPPSLF